MLNFQLPVNNKVGQSWDVFNPTLNQNIKSPETIVVTRLQDLGDMLVFIPFLRNLRNAYPESAIYLITRNELGFEAIKECPYVTEVIKAPKAFWKKFGFYFKLRKISPDLFFFSTTEWGKMKWALLSRAKVTVGYSKLLCNNIEKRVKMADRLTISPEFDNSKNEIENNLDMLRALGIKDIDNAMDYSWISNGAAEEALKLLSDIGIKKGDKFITISPGTKQKTKEWQPENFADVADKIIEKFKIKILLTGSKQDAENVHKIVSAMKNRPYSLAGKSDLKHLPWLLQYSKVLITVDSGPMHFAAALGVPFVALFGPGHYAKWAHHYPPEKCRNIFHPEPCSPCDKSHCDHLSCMKKIGVDEVLMEFQKIADFLKL